MNMMAAAAYHGQALALVAGNGVGQQLGGSPHSDALLVVQLMQPALQHKRPFSVQILYLQVLMVSSRYSAEDKGDCRQSEKEDSAESALGRLAFSCQAAIKVCLPAGPDF